MSTLKDVFMNLKKSYNFTTAACTYIIFLTFNIVDLGGASAFKKFFTTK